MSNLARPRLRHAMIFVLDLPRMAAFYREVLGARVLEATESWVEFDTDGCRFALHAIPAAIANEISIASPPEVREETPVKLVFEVQDMDRVRDRVRELGGSVVEQPWGGCDAVDPEGNVFGLNG